MSAKPEAVARWQIFVPMVQLKVSNDPPLNGRWNVGDIAFLSKEKVEDLLQSSNFDPKSQALVLRDAPAFAYLEREGKVSELEGAVFKAVREAANILAATDAFFSARYMNNGFNLQGYPVVTAQGAYFADKTSDTVLGKWRQRGALGPFILNAHWHKFITETGILELFDAIVDTSIDDKWRRQIRRAAACIGRSVMSLERSDAFLYNIFSMETLLTRKGERNGAKLAKRIKGITGWHLKNHRPNWLAEITDIFEVRCEAVHDAEYGNLTSEHLLLADLYARNSLLNVVTNRTSFPDKDTMVTTLDGWADADSWPTNNSTLKLRWSGNTTFSAKELDLPLW